MTGALEGITVLDCTHVLAGAYCSMLLADLGADVIKIEPLQGEITRGHPKARFHAFDFVNRNKRAIAVDIGTTEGGDLVRRLAGEADVFVENYRVGAMKRYGLDYEALSGPNPGLVYASISGFGQDGPYAERGGLDLVTQAMSGIMSFTGEQGSETPVAAGVPLSDLNAGSFAALGISAALRHREKTGEGQYLETSLLESAMAYTVWETGMAMTMDVDAERQGTRHRLAAPYEALRTSDGWIVVGVNNQRLWGRFCDAIGASQLEEDERFADPRSRVLNRDELQEELEKLLATDTRDHWVERINAKGVPCGPINTIRQALADPHVAARDFPTEVDGRRFPRAPIRMSKTPVTLRKGPSPIGGDTREVLGKVGFSENEIEEFAARKVIGL